MKKIIGWLLALIPAWLTLGLGSYMYGYIGFLVSLAIICVSVAISILCILGIEMTQ